MKLTDNKCKAVKFEGKRLKLTDGNGLYMHLMPTGKYWKWDYIFQGKRKTLSIGVYPSVSLKDARATLATAKATHKSGIDPSKQKQAHKAVSNNPSFESVANEWYTTRNVAPKTQYSTEQRLNKDVFPILGKRDIDSLKPPHIIEVIRIIQDRDSLDAAHKTMADISQVMRYAVSLGFIDKDPCRDIKNQARKNKNVTNVPALTSRKAFGKLLADIDTYDGPILYKYALLLYPHVALRPSELRNAKWDYVDFKKRVIVFPGEIMLKSRTGKDHIVPITDQVFELLNELHKISGNTPLLFPSAQLKDKPLTESPFQYAMHRLGYRDIHCLHGFRSSFSTLVKKTGKFDQELVEVQLHHSTGRVEAAYNRGKYLKRRRKMMQWWSNRIDKMRAKANEINVSQIQ